jgi:hypothetical protein
MMGFNDSSDIYSLLRNHISLHRYIHNGPLLFTVHCSSFILFQVIHKGYTPKDIVIVKIYIYIYIVLYTIKYIQYIFSIDTHTHTVSVANHNIF